MRSRGRGVGVHLGLLAGPLVVALLGPAVATAHETVPTITPVVDGIEPAAAGVDVTVQASQSATLLALEVEGSHLVEVLDEDGRPWARITAAIVEVDVTSPAMQAATSPGGRVPDDLPELDAPWRVVGRDGRFQWFAHELHPAGFTVPEDVLASRRAQDVGTWEVPVRVDGVEGAIAGRIRHVPVTGRVEARLGGGGEVAPGVTVEVAPGPVPVFFLRNDGPVPVTVLDRDGAPYVVVDGAGAAVNRASSTWLEQQRVEGSAPPAPRDASVERVSTTPAHSWIDTRAALPGIVPSDDVRASDEVVELLAWSIPLRVGDELLAIEGTTRWVPLGADAGDGDDAGRALARPEYLVAAGVGLVLLALGLRRRGAGRRPTEDTEGAV